MIVTLNCIGFTQRLKGDYAASLATLQRGLPMSESTGPKFHPLTFLNNLSAVYEAQQQFTPMLTNAQRATDLARQPNAPLQFAQALIRMGKAQRALRQTALAQAAFQTDQVRGADLKTNRQQARLDFEAFANGLYAAHPELKIRHGKTQPIKAEEAAFLLPNATAHI